ncbi:MAG: phosphatase PAP2 family protein [Actinomycetota bacterium]
MRRRVAWISGYGAVSVVLLLASGGAGRPVVLVWLLGLVWLAGWRNEQPVLRALYDWLPLLVILATYDLIRSDAASLVARAHLEPMIWFDELIGFGTAPTVRLQDALLHPDAPTAFDYACLAVYASHFLTAIVVGAVLYFRGRPRFARYAYTFLLCSLAGFATYLAYPAIPPWMASERGALPATVRAPDVLWDHIGVGFLAKVFSGDPRFSNPVGALPSLHAAYPLLFLLLFWSVAGRRGRFVLVAYAAAMAFVLVYFAEHYVFDVLMGWGYAIGAFLVVGSVIAARVAPAPRPQATPQANADGAS